MTLYTKHQKDVKALNSMIDSYEKKLDERVSEVIEKVKIKLCQMMNYSYKTNEFVLPQIENKKTFPQQQNHFAYQRTKLKSISGSIVHTDGEGLDKSKDIVEKKQVKRGRSIGQQKYQRPKIMKKQPEILPKQIRLNPFCQKNAIKAHELEKGMLSLIERGKIAKNIDIITAFEKGRPVLDARPAIFHHAEEKFTQAQMDKYKEISTIIDRNIDSERQGHNWAITNPHLSHHHQRKINLNEKDDDPIDKHLLDQPEPKKEEDLTEGIFIKFLHYKIVYDDNLVELQRKNLEDWGQVMSVISQIEKFLKITNTQLAYANGNKIIAFLYKGKKLFRKQLLDIIVKHKGQNILSISNLKNKAQKEAFAKNLIKSFIYRSFIRKKYVAILRKRRIQKRMAEWLNVGKLIKNYRKQLLQFKEQTYQIFNRQQRQFRINYPTISASKHYEIHIMNKERIDGFRFEEIYNTQITRIFNLSNPNTYIIYICPFQLSLQTMNYYFKIMELEDISSFKDRVLFMEVDHENVLPDCLSTSSKLYYNSKALRKLQRRIKGVPSYFVISQPSEVDIQLSAYIKIPIYTGSSMIFSLPKRELKNVYELQTIQSLYIEPKSMNILSLWTNISKFCEKNKFFTKYVLKLDSKNGSSGLALLQYPFGSLPEMYGSTTLVQPHYFKTIDRFYSKLIKLGGIVQPYHEGITSISVVCKITHDDQSEVLGTFQRVSNGFVNVAYLFPQKAISHQILMEKVAIVMKKAIDNRHMGYLEITFFKTHDDKLYLEDVQPYITKIGSSLIYFKFLAGGNFNSKGEFLTKIADQYDEENNIDISHDMASMQLRNYCYIPFVLHFGFSEKQVTQFFQLCRIGGVSFDLQNKYGSTFILLGSMKSTIGIITTAKQRKNVIKIMCKTLQFLLKQNSHNISDQMLKEKQIRMKQRYNINLLKERLESFS